MLNLLNGQKKGNQGRLNGKHKIMEWIIESGASHHMTRSLKSMSDVKKVLSCPVGLPDGTEVIAEKEGTIVLDKHLKLNNVLYVPNLKCNLVSVAQLINESNCIVQFTNKFCIHNHNSRMLIGAGEQHEGLYYFRSITSVKVMKVAEKGSVDLWHQRLGHPSNKVIRLLPIVNRNNNKCTDGCDVCFRAKHCREEFVSSDNKASNIFEKIHYNLWGPYRTLTFCGAYYFLTIVDDHSRGVWVYLLNNKGEVVRTIQNFFAMVHRQFNKHVKIMRSDNETEFTCLDDYFVEKGVIHQTSCVGTPQQNGRVERKHHQILNVARALHF